MEASTVLKNLRLKRRWTAKKTAEALMVPASTYREWERGRKIQANF